MREKIMLGRFDEIRGVCYGWPTDDAWLRDCCDEELSAVMLDVNAIVGARGRAPPPTTTTPPTSATGPLAHP